MEDEDDDDDEERSLRRALANQGHGHTCPYESNERPHVDIRPAAIVLMYSKDEGEVGLGALYIC